MVLKIIKLIAWVNYKLAKRKRKSVWDL